MRAQIRVTMKVTRWWSRYEGTDEAVMIYEGTVCVGVV